MQGISQADNIGYIVPVPIIQHFLKDLDDGHYDGFPSLGLVMEGMENPDIKKKYGMEPKQTGMLAVKIVRGSPAETVLKEGDVLLSVEDHLIADDGTVDFRDKERTSVSYYIQAHQIGEKLPLEVLRDGKPLKLEVTLNRSMEKDWLIPNDQYDVLPRYYIYGGILFCPLTVNYLKSWGPNWYDAAPRDLTSMLGFNYITDEREEIVLVLKVLAAPVNQGYQDTANWIVTEVDGKKIRNLKELVELVEKGADPFVVFKNKWGHQIVLDRAKAKAAQPQILATYRITEDRSPDLKNDRKTDPVSPTSATGEVFLFLLKSLINNSNPQKVATTRFFPETPSLIINGLRGPQATKKAFSTANSGSWVKEMGHSQCLENYADNSGARCCRSSAAKSRFS